MKLYNEKITLTRNNRGVYCIDPSIGCYEGTLDNKNGCYDDCYSAKIAKRYGYDFSKTIERKFENKKHINSILNKIKKIELPFIRMGCSGDPSSNWEHTLNISKIISDGQKTRQLDLFGYVKTPIEIVIITKHWTLLKNSQLELLRKYNICINTSVSAIDKPRQLQNRVEQYMLLKQYCKSILRIVSFDFNIKNKKGSYYNKIQKDLFTNESIIDTVFRPDKNNKLVTDKIINVHKTKFLGQTCLVSKYNKKTYIGNCVNCIEKCGAGIIK